jgi:hypothetical protein
MSSGSAVGLVGLAPAVRVRTLAELRVILLEEVFGERFGLLGQAEQAETVGHGQVLHRPVVFSCFSPSTRCKRP